MRPYKLASRLERLLDRLTAQKAWLDYAAHCLRDVDGAVLEVGLGKGRTYDHMRRLFHDRRIVAFDLNLHAPVTARPEPSDLFLGDFRDTLPQAATWLRKQPAALIHADFGIESREKDADQAEWLGPLLRPLLQPGGIVLSDRPLSVSGCKPLVPPCPLAWSYYGLHAVPGEGGRVAPGSSRQAAAQGNRRLL